MGLLKCTGSTDLRCTNIQFVSTEQVHFNNNLIDLHLGVYLHLEGKLHLLEPRSSANLMRSCGMHKLPKPNGIFLVKWVECDSLLQYINAIANLLIMGNYFNKLRRKIIRGNNLLQFIHQVTIEFRFRKSLAQRRLKSNLEFRYQIIYSIIKFRNGFVNFITNMNRSATRGAQLVPKGTLTTYLYNLVSNRIKMLSNRNVVQRSKKKGKDQESIQTSSTLDHGYQ